MASTAGDRIELFPASLERQAVTDPSLSGAFDDSALVAAAREGDRAAFGRLYDSYAPMVHGILLARVPPAAVDDLVQDVFLLALPRLHSLRDLTRFGAWLAAIARNRANDYHRQHVEQVELTDNFAADLSSGQARSEVEAASILALIRGLPETYRETLLLRLVEGMTGPEIAARTGLTPGSVRVNLHRGMQQLRDKLCAGRGR